jgi:hypothetical protein
VATRRSTYDLQHTTGSGAHRTPRADGRRALGGRHIGRSGAGVAGTGDRCADAEEWVRVLEEQEEELKERVDSLLFLLGAAVVTLAIVLLFR